MLPYLLVVSGSLATPCYPSLVTLMRPPPTILAFQDGSPVLYQSHTETLQGVGQAGPGLSTSVINYLLNTQAGMEYTGNVKD